MPRLMPDMKIVIVIQNMPIPNASTQVFLRKITSFCELRLEGSFAPAEYENIRSYMLGLVTRGVMPPHHAGKIDWQEIAVACNLSGPSLAQAKRLTLHGFAAITRWHNDSRKAAERARTARARGAQAALDRSRRQQTRPARMSNSA